MIGREPGPRAVSVERHPPERGPQSVVLPSVCCSCCCCCSCCLTTVGAIAGGVAALKGPGDAQRRVRHRVLGLLTLALLPTIGLDLAMGLPLIITLLLLPLTMLAAGLAVWASYGVGLFKDPDRAERAVVRRYLGYLLVGTIIGLVLTLPFLAIL